MKQSIVIILVSVLISFSALAQGTDGVLIDPNNATTRDASAVFQAQSTSQGMLVPRMLAVDRGAIPVSAARNGLLVYQTDGTPGFYYYNGAGWVLIANTNGNLATLSNGTGISAFTYNGSGAATVGIANTGVTAGTYNNVTVNAQGQATSGSNVAYLTGNQSISLTGPVTGTGTTSIATTITDNAVTNAKLADMPTSTFKGRITALTGDPEDLTVAQAKTLLNLTGTNSGDQTITLTSDVTGTGTGSFATTIADNAVDGTDIALGSDATGDVMYYSAGGDYIRLPVGGAGTVLKVAAGVPTWGADNNSGGTVTSVSTAANNNGVTTSWATNTTTPALTIGLGAITPSSVAATGTVTGSNLSGTHSGTSSGTNTGDQTITLTSDVTGSGTGSFAITIADNAVDGTDIALGSDAQGDVMYYSGTDWVRLPAGTSGNFLKTQGAGANPIWSADNNSGGTVTSVATGGNGITGGTITTTGTISLDYGNTTVAGNGLRPQGNFGQFQAHGTTTDANTVPNYWGWNYVQGSTNTPNATSSQWYREVVSLGSDYPARGAGGYSMELAFPRFNTSTAGVWMRTVENGTIGGWSRIDAGATTYANLTGIPTRTAWNGVHRNFVAEQLSWKNYGNNHTIFDASAGTSPDGGAVNNTNSQVAWAASYPTLMGWNGTNTYGVRVDAARVADNVAWTGVTGRPTALSSFTNDLGNYGGWIPNNGNGDWQIASSSTSTGYGQATLELRESNFTGNGSATPPHLGFHWGGVIASNIAIESSGRIAIRDNPGTGYENFIALDVYASRDMYSSAEIYVNNWVRHNDNDGTYWSNNNWHIYPQDGSDMNLRVGSGNGGIRGTLGDATARGYVHWTTSNEIGFLNSGRGWSLRVDNAGNSFATTSSRAPIFYDNDNTGYYTDPASTSILNNLRFNTSDCINGTCPPNNAIRMTPNFHLNSGAGYAVILNWDNGTTGASQTLRIGNGASADVYYVTAQGYSYANRRYSMDGQGVYTQAQVGLMAQATACDFGLVGVHLENGNSEGAGFHGDGDNANIWSAGDGDRLLRVHDEDAMGTEAASERWYLNGSGSAYTVSDVFKKQNIHRVTGALSKIIAISGYNYEFKKNAEELAKGDMPSLTAGVIAQEVEVVMPELVDTNEEGNKFMDYAGLTPYLIEAIKEQQQQIEALKTNLSDFGSAPVAAKELWVNFNSSFVNSMDKEQVPVVTVTANQPGVNMYVTEKNSNGFKLVVFSDLPAGLSIDYVAMAHVQKSVAQPVLEKDWNAVSATKPYTVKQTELKENSAAAIDINAAAAKVNQAIIDSEKNQPSKEKTETPVIVPVE